MAAPRNTADNEDLSPSDFVKKIRELGQRKDSEDAERLALLERDILQGREERAARRAERARSISPEKFSSTPPPRESSNSPVSPFHFAALNIMAEGNDGSVTPPSRAGTLSWQQRPKSSGGRRPLSMLAAENAARSPRATPESAKHEAAELSRKQIEESLASKDPEWFRQTADRGVGSAAYRRAQEGILDATEGAGRARGAGLYKESTFETDKASSSSPPGIPRSTTSSRVSSTRTGGTSSLYPNTASTPEPGLLRMMSPPPSLLDAPKLTSSSFDRKSPLAGRPPSPTKGMGGFVESAMLKRADSVSKRWSTQTPIGLNRGDSTASNRSSYTGGLVVSGSASPARLNRSPTRTDRSGDTPIRDNSLELGSRPSSSQSNRAINRNVDDYAVEPKRDESFKLALPHHNRAKSVASLQDSLQDPAERPGSTSPTRRWSPTKSSWLESALTKTEEKSKSQRPPSPSQPSWMAELNKAKQQNSSASLADSPPKLVSPERFDQTKLRSVDRFDSPKLTSPERFQPKSRSSQPESPIQNFVERVESQPASVTSNPAHPTTPFGNAISPPPESASKPLVSAKQRWAATPKDKLPSSVTSPPGENSWEVKRSAVSPGKFDFRANLKSRQTSNDDNAKDEPEFKNALGKLKKTQTEKFTAPDMLKDNILRGKADLAATGGPLPRVRKDELKEDILKQKEVMKVKAAEPKRLEERPVAATKTPEALAKRSALHRSPSPTDSSTAGKNVTPSSPEAITRLKALKERSKPELPRKTSNTPPKEVTRSIDTLRLSLTKQGSASNPNPSTAVPSKTSREVKEESHVSPFTLPGLAKPKSSGRLADRFNPALAGILARGPPASGKSEANTGLGLTTIPTAPPAAGPLEHKTKGRARGPKRRAPTRQEEMPVAGNGPTLHASANETTAGGEPSEFGPRQIQIGPSPAHSILKSKSSTLLESHSAPAPSKNESLSNASFMEEEDVLLHNSTMSKASNQFQPSEIGNSISRPISTPMKLKPFADTISTTVSTPLSPHLIELENIAPEPLSKGDLPTGGAPFQMQNPGFVTRPPPPVKPSPIKSPDLLTPLSSFGKDSPIEPESVDPDVSLKGATTLWGRKADATAGPFSPGRPDVFAKLPAKHDEENMLQNTELMRPPTLPGKGRNAPGLGLGISATLSTQVLPKSKADDRTTRKHSLSPPMSSGQFTKTTGNGGMVKAENPNPVPRLEGARSRPASASLKQPPESPMSHTSEAARLFEDFFDDRPVVTPQLEEVDTAVVLESYPIASTKVSTISKQLQMISGAGKLLPVPSHQEHILYSDSMYICTHTFKSATGSKCNEVYLWAGSDVPQASFEDSHLFGRRVAKQYGGKLIILRQGKETPNFFQAIGGILTTFRGSRSQSSSGVPATFMLCGRRHLGQIAFDEVDMSLNSLCSGFPYLVSSPSRLYLWKGKGCGAEELGCARLIAMDLGHAPDVTEIQEGEEPESFFALFTDSSIKSIPRSADHWRLKATNDKYRCRLFHVVQHTNRSSTVQVSSFFNKLTRQSSWSSPFTTTTTTSPSTTPPTLYEQPKSPTTGSRMKQTTTSKIVEIAPFTQGDLEAEGIFVLDAFFEVYILIGPLARSQAQAFAAALRFAQDYGILAASLEDRPFVPISTVVLEGVPRDMKPCFRQWSDEAFNFGNTEALMAGRPRRGGSLRCLGLATALAATRS